MGIIVANNAISRLASGITSTVTSLNIAPGEGSRFPALSAGNWFPVVVLKSTGELEIMKCTARSVDTLTVERAQETTMAMSFSAGDRVEVRMTAGVFSTLKAEMFAELMEQGSQLANLLPPGTGPIPWSLAAEPAGWIFADGRTLDLSSPHTTLRQSYIDAGYPFGNDSGHPKIPDMRGRVVAGKDDLGGTAARRLTTASGVDGAVLGASGGAETHTLTTDQTPGHTHTATATDAGSHAHSGTTDTEAAHAHTGSTGSAGGHSHTITTSPTDSGGSGSFGTVYSSGSGSGTTSTAAAHTHTLSINAGGAHAHTVSTNTEAAHTHGISVSAVGSGLAHPNVQPTLVANWIVKV